MPSRDWALGQGLNGQHLHRVTDWSETIQAVSPVSVDCGAAGAWLNGIFASKVH